MPLRQPAGGQVEQHAQMRRPSALGAPGWNNTTVFKGDVISEISKPKKKMDGE